MGYVTILGITFWIPDFTDLYNFVVKPLQDAIATSGGSIISGILSYVQTIASQVYVLLKPLIDPIWNFLQGVASKVLELIRPLITPILEFLRGIANQIWQFVKPTIDALWSMIKPAIDNLWAFMKGIVSQITATVKPWIDALGAAIKGDLASLWTLVKPAIDNILGALNRAIPQLSLGILGLQIGLDALSAKISGQPVEIDKIFSAKINETLNPFVGIDKSLWTGLMDILGPAFQGMVQGLFTSLEQVWQGWLTTFTGFTASSSPITPLEAANRIATMATSGLVAQVGADIVGIGVEALGAGQLEAPWWSLNAMIGTLGISGIVARTFETQVNFALLKPWYRYLNEQYSPEVPPLKIVDQMLFEHHIELTKWFQFYRWAGWKMDDINAWRLTMYREPSDRMVVGMIEGGVVPIEWLTKKLTERGYTEEDAAMILSYGVRKALADEIKAIINEVQADLAAGQIDITEAEAEVQEVGVTGKELEFRVRAMKRRIARSDIKDKIAILTSQVRAGDLTIPRFRQELIALGLRIARVTSLVEKEELRQKPQVDKPKERKRELAISFYVRLFIEGTIDEPKLRRYLGELTPALKPEDLELIVTDAKIRRTKALAAAA